VSGEVPRLDGGRFLSDGGIETVLVFHDGIDLPEFAAFPLLATEEGTETLRAYHLPYLAIAAEAGPASCSRARRGARARAGPSASAATAPRSTGSTSASGPTGRSITAQFFGAL